jgi:hypothetical protein
MSICSSAAGISTVHAAAMNLSMRSAGIRPRVHTSRARTAHVFTSDHSQPGSSGPAPPPRNSGTATAAATVSSPYRPARKTSRSGPDSSATAPPARSAPTGWSNGPQNVIASAETR